MSANPIIIALDFSSKAETAAFLKKMGRQKLFVKTGMELFYKEGPAIVEWLKSEGHEVFLDLKLHDIPNTVNKAMKVLASLQPDLINVHAAGGRAMMEAAVEGLEAGTPAGFKRPRLIGVTQLTSTSDEMLHHELLITREMDETVMHYAGNVKRAGLDGIVCSVWESNRVKAAFGGEFITVTPGIRLAGDAAGDQSRIATPEKARAERVTHIVAGRSITEKEDPLKAYQQMQKNWEEVHR
ncbi:orotidine-5'-phosphate decarboxylase [Bacillus sp. FJAT-42376]|uniref:orotidine-5'-phosphate decarboxylase n=1 Tax=Bacillus sp. FJAT-42376 TaxID=2014076 RepID=UPI000F4F4104|nr:orotidine-5'-phosphate decarboxylase [Bacillus sp. FJAT-42376]AZB42867.1 orotidine-5'-phosphate decarboxylase [Bacillus sp. FJAT-42376]